MISYLKIGAGVAFLGVVAWGAIEHNRAEKYLAQRQAAEVREATLDAALTRLRELNAKQIAQARQEAAEQEARVERLRSVADERNDAVAASNEALDQIQAENNTCEAQSSAASSLLLAPTPSSSER